MAKRPDTTAPAPQPEAPRLRRRSLPAFCLPRHWRVHARRWLVNLGLLAIVATLATFTVYQRQQGKTESGLPLATLTTEDVGRIRIERHGQSAIVLEKHAENWRLVSPVAARANRFNVENLLRVGAARSELKLDGGDPAAYGLVTPQAKLEVGAELFEFGTLHPFHSQVYVRHRGVVHLVSAQALHAVLRATNHFIDARLLEPERRLVGLRLPGLTLDLKDGRWQHQPPTKDLASDRVNDFVARWTNAHALAAEPAGTRPALASVRLMLTRDSGPETLTLEIVSYKPTFVLRRRDEKLEYHFPEEIGKRLLDIGNDG
ncbi:MAG TPA: DUF4340 domain-containing protein [Burkholderiales bacterium]|nr:DUF4340 domain-containing protein [Burkholderiales bacterium]